MTTRILAFAFVATLATMAGQTAARADTLLVDRVKQEQNLSTPRRGMSMAQVESRFGAPKDKLSPAGGDTKLHPVINRWVYDNYIVYFERDRVITTVAARATPYEAGPKPANQ